MGEFVPRRKRRRVVVWTYYDWWRALLSCGHEVWLDGPVWGKHARRTCKECSHA